MHDSYLLLTPLLTFLVVALVGFVGCDSVFGLHRVDDPPEPLQPVQNVNAVGADQRVDVSWDAYSGASSYFVHWGESSGNRPESHEVTSGTSYSIPGLINGKTYYVVVNAKVNAMMTPDSEEKTAVPGIYGVVTPLIATKTPGNPRNFTGLMGMGFTVGSKPIDVVALGRLVTAGNTGTHAMKLVDAASRDDVPGSNVNVPVAGGTVDEFAYADLPVAITLSANTTYYLVSEESTAGDQFRDSVNTFVTTTNAASRAFAAFGDFARNYTEDTLDGRAYGPVDLKYVIQP